jgi:exonuclease SbcC
VIPVSLHLSNFLSYRVMPEPLDFTGITLACLSGSNGHGKSALLDAVTWALWGRARGATGGKEQERLIADGAVACSVELVFSLDGDRYRVRRELWRPERRSGSESTKSALSFAVQAAGGVWTDLAGEGIRDTQRRIDERLRMDYETFVASAFILQGRADTFTSLDPARRKEVLGKILGIEIYERFAESAREKRKESAGMAAGLEGELQSLERDLEETPALRDQQERATADLSRIVAERAEAEAAARAAQDAATRIRALEASAERARRHVESIAGDRDGVGEELRRLERRIADLDSRAVADEETASKAAAATDLATRADELETSRKRHDQLLAEAAALAARIAQERARLEAESAGLDQRIASIERDLASVPQARRRLEEAREALAALEEIALRREALIEEHSTARASLEAIKARAKERAARAAEVDEKLALLKRARASCPLCGEALTAEHRRRISAEFQARRRELVREADGDSAQGRAIAARMKSVEREIAATREPLETREALATRIGTLTEALDAAARAADEGDRLRSDRARLGGLLEREEFAPTERDKLAAVLSDARESAYDPSAHEALRAALEEAHQAERRLGAALQARAALEEASKARDAVAARLEALAGTLRAATEELAALERDVAGRDDAFAAAESATKRLEQIREAEQATASMKAVAEERLAALAAKAARASPVRASLAEAKRRGRLYDKLVKAFGRDGIPARIVGNAIPELAHEANRLLNLLSDGRMSLAIDPVRRTKAGTVRESLDIAVFDGGEKRFYEMYSGGERLRIDVALRVALSRLLTHRAGARLETLVVDEGFGTQDAEGRARLVQAILRIRGDFGLILVISHLDEIKEHFPTRIEVSKDPVHGSRAVVV